MLGYYWRVYREVNNMEMSFKNGSKVCVPEDVTAIYSSAPTDGLVMRKVCCAVTSVLWPD